MVKLKNYKRRFIEHSVEFKKILKESFPDKAIKAITHKEPLLVFWVNPEGNVIDAKNAHFDNPPNNDKSVLSHKTHKGHLRGRAAKIGNIIYVVIYGDLNIYQEALLKKSYPKILRSILNKNKILTQDDINSTIFINENGNRIIF